MCLRSAESPKGCWDSICLRRKKGEDEEEIFWEYFCGPVTSLWVHTITSALQNLWAQSKAAVSVPSSSQSRDVWVYIIFTSVSYLFLLGVQKQPSWPHLKEEKGDTYPKARNLHRVTNLPCEHTPLLSQITFLSFQLGSSQDEKPSVALEQAFVDSCLTPTIAQWGCWGEEKPRCPSEGHQEAQDGEGHTACVFQILWGSSLDPSGLSHFSAQMWKLCTQL